jgi:RHS repeat-associated core domain
MKTKNHIFFIFLCCVPLLLWAQAPSYTLDSTETGQTKQYIARDYIELTPGFTYDAQNSKTFLGEIDPALLFPPTENTYAKPDGTITTDPALGSVVGSISGQFAVSPSGAATYSIPIEVPAGINGMQPNVSLVYNSQSGNGIAGWGWNISGISSVSVIGKTPLSDNKTTGIRLEYGFDSQKYVLDGNVLILTNDNNGVKTYITEKQSFVQIVYSNSKFIVTDKNGTIMEYAKTVTPKEIQSQWAPSPYQWLLTKVMDANGNFMTYSYKSNGNQTQVVLDKIEYTGNGNIAPTLKVQFVYEEKSFKHRLYIGGYYLEDFYLLKKITVSSNSTKLREYEFIQTVVNDKYFLTDVTLTGENSEKVKPTIFTYGENNEDVTVTAMSLGTSYLYESLITPGVYDADVVEQMFVAADINGDGFSDLVELSKVKVHYDDDFVDGEYIPYYYDYTTVNSMIYDNGSFGSDSTFTKKTGGSVDFGVAMFWNGKDITANFNGSQKKTVLIPRYTNIGRELDIKDLTSGILKTYSLKLSNTLPIVTVADLNNDGIDEIIVVERVATINGLSQSQVNALHDGGKNGFIIYVKKNDLSKEYLTSADELIVKPLNFSGLYVNSSYKYNRPEVRDITISDFNADGMNDIMIMTSAGAFVMRNDGGTSDNDSIVKVSFGQLTGMFSTLALDNKAATIKTGDFNGDGQLDLLKYDGNGNFMPHIRNGYFGFSETDIIAGVSFVDQNMNSTAKEKNEKRDDYIVIDFNHDGKSDLITIDAKYSGSNYTGTKITWYESTGTDFIAVKTIDNINCEHCYFKGWTTTGDFDGDGREDLYSYSNINLYTGTSGGGFYTWHDNGLNTNLLKTVDNGIVPITEIKYRPLNYTNKTDDDNFYIRDTSAVYPAVDFQESLYCVESVTNETETENYKLLYYYEGAKVHIDKGFLGFTKTIEKDSLHEQKVVTAIEIDYEMCLPEMQKQAVTNFLDEEVSVLEKYFKNSKSGNVYTSTLDSTVNTDMLRGIQTTTKYINYDNYGNLLTMRTAQGDIVKTDSIFYVNRGGWCNNKPSYTRTITSYQNQNDTVVKTFEYDNKGNLTKQILYPNKTLFKVETSYLGYNAFGLPCTLSVKAKNATGIEETRTFQTSYTNSGRFVASKTDVLGQTTTYDWDETCGLLNYEIDHWGNKTSYTYDNWGKLKETLYPDGTRSAAVLQWAGNGNSIGAKFYSYAQSSGSAPVKIWYDGLGRKLQTDTYGLDGNKISVSTEYNSKGQVYRVSEPYFENDTKIWAAIYSYDAYGRDTSVITQMGTITTVYDSLTTAVTTPEGISKTILNTSGQTIRSEQNGKGVDYTYYPSGLTKTATPDDGQLLTMEYDLHGNRTKLIDPDAGEIQTTYNGFGELVETRQKIHNANTWNITTNNYDSKGLLQSITRGNETTVYIYDTDLGHPGRVKSIEIAGQHKQSFTYDDLGRITRLREEIDSKTIDSDTEYDILGRVKKEIYSSGYYTVNHYDKNGYMYKVTDGAGRDIWQALAENAKGQIRSIKKGSVTTDYQYNNYGLLTNASSDDGNINWEYNYDPKGNLFSREDYFENAGSDEFSYDNLNRLTSWEANASGPLAFGSITYEPLMGNIQNKTDLGAHTLNYGKNNYPPHAISSISGVPESIPNVQLDISYTDFQKVKTLAEGNKHYALTYGVDDQRRKSVYKENNIAKETRYYFGDYEEKIDHTTGVTEKTHYLRGAIYIERSNDINNFYYAHSDNIGSLILLTDENGNEVERYAYDPWGRRRDPYNWGELDTRTELIVNRGYTMHEHLDMFNVINMNGRVYDPLTASFFSPDPYIQAPDNWLNYNRYSYVLNNPFKYTDPSGENPVVVIAVIAGAIIGGYAGGVAANSGELNPVNWDWRDPTTYVMMGAGMIIGAVAGYGIAVPGSITFGVGLFAETPYGGIALGVGGITATGTASDWNFHWSTSAGGGGSVPFKKQQPIKEPKVKKSNSDSRFLNASYYEASQFLSYLSREKGVELCMYETGLGYYIDDANGYVFADLSKGLSIWQDNTNYTYYGTREDGRPIYYVESTISTTYPFSLSQQGQNLYLNLSMGERYRVTGFYHTHPGNTMLSLDDPFQGMPGVRVRTIGWDGRSRGSYFDNNTYYIDEFDVIGRKPIR